MKIQEIIDFRKPFAYSLKKMINIYKDTFQRSAPEFYGPIVEGLLVARYKPWDKPAEKVYKTALSKDRLHIIEQILRLQFRRSQSSAFMEFGIYEGGVTKMMLDLNKEYERKNRVYAVDSFEGVRGALKDSDNHENGDYACHNIESAKEYIKGAEVFQGIIPDILTKIHLYSRDVVFAHIDLDVYLPTLRTIEWVDWHSSTYNAMMIVDDYGLETCPGVKQAVDEFMAGPSGVRWALIYLPTGQALLIKT